MTVQEQKLFEQIKKTTEKLTNAGYSVSEAKNRIMSILDKHRADIDNNNTIKPAMELAFIEP